MGSGKRAMVGCDPGANDSGSIVRIRVQRGMSQCRGTVANKNTRIQTTDSAMDSQGKIAASSWEDRLFCLQLRGLKSGRTLVQQGSGADF